MDLSLHVVQPFQPVPPAADRRRKNRDAPAFELKPQAREDALHEEAPTDELRSHEQTPHTAVHEDGVGERIDVVA